MEFVDFLPKGISPVKTDSYWIHIGKTQQTQGWKIHLSSIPVEASSLLQKITPILLKRKVAFKVAKNVNILESLNSGMLGYAQIGKFITIYPENSKLATSLVSSLIGETTAFNGPFIPSDFPIQNIIYARYGAFNPIYKLDRFGQRETYIKNTKGQLIKDIRSIPFKNPTTIENPFLKYALKNNNSNTFPNKLFGSGFLMLKILRKNAKGNTYLAMDLRKKNTPVLRIIKQGKAHCCSDRYGRDMNYRLKSQLDIHQKLSGSIPIPEVDSFFEWNRNGYLVLEYIEGETFEQYLNSILKEGSWVNIPKKKLKVALDLLIQLINIIGELHKKGYVHRDLSPSNVIINPAQKVHLIDLELAFQINDTSPPLQQGTPGFISPQQEKLYTPTIKDDIYSFGCLLLLLLTGLDPRRTVYRNNNVSKENLSYLCEGTPPELLDLALQCIDANPNKRPTCSTIFAQLKKGKTNCSAPLIEMPNPCFNLLIEKGTKGLLNQTFVDGQTGFWLSKTFNMMHEQKESKVLNYELQTNMHRGLSGMLYLICQLKTKGQASQKLLAKAQTIISYLLDRENHSNDNKPGLFFGKAGIALGIAMAIDNEFIEDSKENHDFIYSLLKGKLDWPDMTHGAAGQGLAALHCYKKLQNPTYLKLSKECAHYLRHLQLKDGSWRLPEGVEGLSMKKITGFAHGVAGILFFLISYFELTKNQRIADTIDKGMKWLTKEAIINEKSQNLEWKISPKDSSIWHWWCHGAPGIALVYLKYYELTKDEVNAQIARKALNCLPLDFRYANLSICHGISGLGELYLEAFHILKEPIWYQKANHIGRLLYALSRNEGGDTYWYAEDLKIPLAGLIDEMGGIIHFLLRLEAKDRHIRFPLLF